MNNPDHTMSIRFGCDSCDQHLEADKDMVGLLVNCSGCGKSLVVPKQSTLPLKISAGSSDISFCCNRCGQDIVIEAAGAGLTVVCPKCSQSLIVPGPSRKKVVSVVQPPAPPPADTKKCPFCAEQIRVEATKCKHCGSMLVEASPPVIRTKDEERVFYEGAYVSVTQSRFVVGSETYAMRNITSVRSAKRDPDYSGVGKCAAIGALVALSGYLFGWVAGLIGFVLIGLAVLCATQLKPTYFVILTTSAGEVSPYASSDVEEIALIVKALEDSIIVRG